ncbi:2-phospho-L-lactate guanylyltransferase [Streptomyces sp. JJ36]|nr:2-phospho-L-lactate guanylyltransferase [Streptomyces sp. JJ36]
MGGVAGDDSVATGPAWSLVIPLKPLSRAKSRLGTTAGDAVRPGLALAFAQDTVSAALACRTVRSVVVVTDDPLAAKELSALGAGIVPDVPGAGLNAALTHGEAVVRAGAPRAAVAALNADLPALRPYELERVLAAAAGSPRAFLPDAAGTGTTLLTALPGSALAPAFGPASRARHRASGAVELRPPGVPGVRQDVDTAADLRTALGLGVGVRTAAAAARTLLPMQATAYTYDPGTRTGSVLLDDGSPLSFDAAAFDAGGLRMLRPGQRVRIEVEGEGDARRIALVTLQTL